MRTSLSRDSRSSPCLLTFSSVERYIHRPVWADQVCSAFMCALVAARNKCTPSRFEDIAVRLLCASSGTSFPRFCRSRQQHGQRRRAARRQRGTAVRQRGGPRSPPPRCLPFVLP